MSEPQQIDPQEIIDLLSTLLTNTAAKHPAATPEARRLAALLSDDFAEENDAAAFAVRETIRLTKEVLPEKDRLKLQDVLDVALARIDVKASLRYWLRDDDGQAIKLTALNCFEIDFFKYAHQDSLIPILFAPMGSGKTTLIRGLICFEIGQNQDTMQQLVCQSDKAAQQRGLKIMDMLMSPHYQKVYPHIKKDMRQWGNEGFLVQRTRATVRDVTMDSKGNAGGVDPTLGLFGVTSRAMTGTRTFMTDLDDVVTVESGIQNPKEGETIDEALKTKVFTREKAPIGKTDQEYDRSKNETRFRIIGTPYAQTDPIYQRRDWKGAATAVIGINDDFTAYNVQIWGLPEKYYKKLKKKYGTGTIKFPKMPEETKTYCEAEGIPTPEEYTLGPGVKKDHVKPPDFTMEIELAIPREWYLDKYEKAAEDRRSMFNLPYKCEVQSDSELMFPSFRNSIFKYYPDYDNQYNPKWEDEPIPMLLEKSIIVTNQNNLKVSTGMMARLIAPPNDYKIKIAMVDLSKKGRKGTVITVAVLTPSNRRRIVEIRRGGWGGEEIADQIGEVFKYHPDLQVCYIESVTLQSLFVDLLKASKEKYEWWPKVGYFEETTSSKNDPQIGISIMGIGYAAGAFELPDVTGQVGHGNKCECGYCVGIKDGTRQSRLAPVESDVLITFWGVHLKMPLAFKYTTGLPPTTQKRAQSGYELGATTPGATMGAKIMGTGSPVVKKDKKENAGDLPQSNQRPNQLLPTKQPEVDPGWGSPYRN